MDIQEYWRAVQWLAQCYTDIHLPALAEERAIRLVAHVFQTTIDRVVNDVSRELVRRKPTKAPEVELGDIRTGDHVQISTFLPTERSHFPRGEAIVISSYYDEYGHGPKDKYSLYIKGHGPVSWYRGEDLVLVQRNRCDLLYQWRKELESHKHD